jgi:ABC-type cobalamin/Fe3+-siderophores transport system ATPase subunit
VKITSFLPLAAQVTELGLIDVKFRGLGQLVVLAGPNGSGKSRVLQLLFQAAAFETNRLSTKANLLQNKNGLESLLYQSEQSKTVEERAILQW